jgi:hypothetical protein
LCLDRAAVDWVEKPLWTTVDNFPAPAPGPKQGPYDAFANPPRPQVRVRVRASSVPLPPLLRGARSQHHHLVPHHSLNPLSASIFVALRGDGSWVFRGYGDGTASWCSEELPSAYPKAALLCDLFVRGEGWFCSRRWRRLSPCGGWSRTDLTALTTRTARITHAPRCRTTRTPCEVSTNIMVTRRVTACRVPLGTGTAQVPGVWRSSSHAPRAPTLPRTPRSSSAPSRSCRHTPAQEVFTLPSR